MTNRHVVAGAATLEVSTFDGKDIDVRTSGAATVADLAIVRTKESSRPRSRSPRRIPKWDRRSRPSATPWAAADHDDGAVLGYRQDPVAKSELPMLLNSAPVEHGSSGSPLVDITGELVGVVYASTGPGRNYAVPIEVLEDVLGKPQSFTDETDCDE